MRQSDILDAQSQQSGWGIIKFEDGSAPRIPVVEGQITLWVEDVGGQVTYKFVRVCDAKTV